MKRKLLVNLFIALVVFPVLFLLKNLKNIVTENYQYYDSYYDSLGSYLKVLIHPLNYPLVPILFLITVLLPFQLLKDWHFKKKNRDMPFLAKVVLLIAIALFWMMLLPFVTIHTFFINPFVSLGIVISCILITFILNVLVDHVETNKI
ncbi:hypothetical protein [Sphingobacterium prati]|uniref:hypothetical protein n=1 Tax=Sphingobacterium prati TaxID=2737006 RepID=UPI0015544F07|nr:hypothetical protein [Sphingobacterium prati]NPE44991.1 hypothetical protein [Sphingobacterium prati]